MTASSPVDLRQESLTQVARPVVRRENYSSQSMREFVMPGKPKPVGIREIMEGQ